MYVGQIPGGPAEPMLFGDILIDLKLTKRGGLVVGLRTPGGDEVINPPKTMTVEPGTHLLYLAKEPLLEPPT